MDVPTAHLRIKSASETYSLLVSFDVHSYRCNLGRVLVVALLLENAKHVLSLAVGA